MDLLLPGGAKPVQSTISSSGGLFAFTGAEAGVYDVTVAVQGFRKETLRGITLTAGTEVALPVVRLEIGTATETVEVKESTSTVQTNNAEITTNISHQQVQDLPILNRSPQGFVDTQAGVTLGRGGDSVINGQRYQFHQRDSGRHQYSG